MINPNMNPIDGAIAALSMNPPGFVKSQIKANIIKNTRKAITVKVKADRKTAWTPELVVSRMHEDTDADVFVLFGLLDIGDAELLEIARGALVMIGISCPEVVSSIPAPANTATLKLATEQKSPGLLAQFVGWIKNMFWSVKK